MIITKDDDFVKSFVNRKVPEKMIFLFGSQSRSEDLDLVKMITPSLVPLLKNHDFIEVRSEGIRFPFSD